MLLNAWKAMQTGWASAKVVVLGGNVVSLSLILRPKTAVQCCSEALFCYKAISHRGRLREKRVFDVLPFNEVVSISLGNLPDGFAWFRPEGSYMVDLISLCMICRHIKPKAIFEIGTFSGYSTYEFALNSPGDTKIYSLDLPPASKPSLKTTASDDLLIEGRATETYAFQNTPEATKINLLFGDSATFDFSAYHGAIDFFFIDGAHSYEYVRSDTLNALKCCHPGSVIAWHDFGRAGVNGVSRWLREFSKQREVYSVPGGSLAFAVV
jgi:predicted O-methyltransferase YrrM